MGFGWAEAQDSSFRITDSKGREVIVYRESHALVIWAGNYQYWNKLNNIENEAYKVKSALEKQGFKVKMVANPTGDILNSEIKKFINAYGYQTDNRLVFFFAGHGYTRQKTKGYFVPIDAPDPAVNPQNEQDFLSLALSMEEVETWAKRIEAKHALFVFDSCFSGTIFKQRSNSAKQSYIEAIMNKPVREFLTAGDADQRVPAKSVFTLLFIRALEGEADLYKDGYITGNELGLYLRQNLGDYTKEQTPQFGTIRDPELDQGDIVFRALNASPVVATSSPRPDSSLVVTNSSRSQFEPTPTTTPQPQPISSPQLTAEAFYESGLKKYKSGNKKESIIDFTQSIKLGAANYSAYYLRGNAKFDLGDSQGAISDYNLAIIFLPNYAAAYNNRGRAKFSLRDEQGAFDDFNKAIQLRPNYSPTYYNRGNAKFSLGDEQGAISDYNQAITLRPKYSEAYFARGIAKNKLGEKQGAISDFQKAADFYQKEDKMDNYKDALNQIKKLQN